MFLQCRGDPCLPGQGGLPYRVIKKVGRNSNFDKTDVDFGKSTYELLEGRGSPARGGGIRQAQQAPLLIVFALSLRGTK